MAVLETAWERRRRIVADELERAAVDFIAERGFHAVTIEEIAAATGVSPRTLTRHFPTKEDLLLSLPRRSALAMAEALARAETTDEPVADLWKLWGELVAEYRLHLDFLFRWQRAASTAPEVVARARGQQLALLEPELVGRCARALGVDAAQDVRPHVTAAVLLGANAAVVDFWLARGGEADLSELFIAALASLRAQFASPRLRRQVERHRAGARSQPAARRRRRVVHR